MTPVLEELAFRYASRVLLAYRWITPAEREEEIERLAEAIIQTTQTCLEDLEHRRIR